MQSFTKNEKETLKLILGQSKITDSEISDVLKVSSQAVGKIRKKLEGELIEGYNPNINFSKGGLNFFYVCKGRLKNVFDRIFFEQRLVKEKHVIGFVRLSGNRYGLMFGFRNIQESESFFNSKKIIEEFLDFFKIEESDSFSNFSLLKCSTVEFFLHSVDFFKSKNRSNKSRDFF